jgi:hypothetical protein
MHAFQRTDGEKPTQKPLYTPKLAAKFLGKSESWLAKARMIGAGPRYVKVGANVRYDVNDLVDWIEANKSNSTSETRQTAGAEAA